MREFRMLRQLPFVKFVLKLLNVCLLLVANTEKPLQQVRWRGMQSPSTSLLNPFRAENSVVVPCRV